MEWFVCMCLSTNVFAVNSDRMFEIVSELSVHNAVIVDYEIIEISRVNQLNFRTY